MNLLLSRTSVRETKAVHPRTPTCEDTADMGGGQERGDKSIKDQNLWGPYMERTQDMEKGEKAKTQHIKEGGKGEMQVRGEGDKNVGDKKEVERIHDWKEGGKDSESMKEGDGVKPLDKDDRGKEGSQIKDKEGGGNGEMQGKEEEENDIIKDKMSNLEVRGALGEVDTKEGLLSEVQEEASSETVTGSAVHSLHHHESRSKRIYTLDEVSYHCDPSSCWIVLWDHVYDVTSFIQEHPGGEDIIYEHGGRDATFTFSDVGHSNDALLMIMPYEIGVLVEHEKIFKRQKTKSLSH